MKCKKCGEQLPIDSNFCEFCGTKVTEEEKQAAIDVADLGPDDLDDLMPKKKHPLGVFFVILIAVILIGALIFYKVDETKKSEQENQNSNQYIIDEYAKAIEKVASDYLLDHEVIEDFDEIKDLVKYSKHKVECDNVFVNIDGTVYLSDCRIDGTKVTEGYGKRKDILSKDDACSARYDEDKDEINFYVDDELISVYECQNGKCGLYETDNFKYNSCMDMIAVIVDGDQKYLYNYQSLQNISGPLKDIALVKNGEKVVGFIVQDIDTEKYGYVTTRGTEKLKLKYDTLALISNSKIYEQSIDIKNNKITASENGKYGVIDLSNGNTIIDFKYDNIYLGPNNYYVVKQNGSYYLIDKDGNKIIDKGYEMIFAFDKVLVVCENDEIKILDYDGKRLIDTKIQTFINYKEQPIDDIFGYMATKNSSNDIIIEVNKSNSDNSKINRYIYHIDTKKLEVK